MKRLGGVFSTPQNPKKITPPAMGFNIIMGGDTNMYPGQIIAYKVKPLLGIPSLWVTEITHVETNSFFGDEQVEAHTGCCIMSIILKLLKAV